MPPSMFQKRKAKETGSQTQTSEVTPEIEHTFPYSGYDVYSPDGNGSFRLAEIVYNPETGDAKVVDTYEVTRLIGLQFDGNKKALGFIKKQKRQKSRNPS